MPFIAISSKTLLRMPVILFVCTANRFRSPIAAACAELMLCTAGQPGEWTVISAGTWSEPGLPAHPKAILAAAALGLDLSAHRTREVNTALMAAADLVIVMEHGHKEALECEFPTCRGRIVLLGELAGERNPEIPDPAKTDFEESDAIAGTIAACIENGFTELLSLAEFSHSTRRNQKPKTAINPLT
jgi:protein-tyrosine-phosphatase